MICINNFLLTCGSIINGHLWPLVTKIPLSTDTSSDGRPQIFHSRTSTGVDKMARSVQFDEHGIFSFYIGYIII
jgi:hypothetical protein